jgi:hypothetical protein
MLSRKAGTSDTYGVFAITTLRQAKTADVAKNLRLTFYFVLFRLHLVSNRPTI